MATNPNSPQIVPLNEWLAESLRATIFPPPGVAPVAETWWRDTLNREPDTRAIKPATREHLEEGLLEGAKLLLTVNPIGVVQWQVVALPPTEVPSDLLAAGPLMTILPSFIGLLERWFPMCPGASRIAFGAVGLLRVSGHREAYERLATFLRSVKIDPEKSTDFLYRINRPRESITSISDLRINRLSTWHAIRMGVLASPTGSGPYALINERHACRVEVDINTVPTFQGTFTPHQVTEVFRELQRLGLEIIEAGDIE